MKQHYIKFCILSFLLIFAVGCTDDHADLLTPAVSVDAAALPVITEQVGSFFDLTDLANSQVSFTIGEIEGGASATSITLTKRFNGGEEVDHATVEGIPATFTITTAQAADGLGITTDDLVVGDNFEFLIIVNTNNGSFRSNRNVAAVVSCSSDLAGLYESHTVYGYHDFLPDFSEHTTQVEIVQENDGIYFMEDLSGGLYSVGPYVAAYATTGVPGTFRDVCNTISLAGNQDDWGAFGDNADQAASHVDPETGVITLYWKADAYGENGVTTLTPVP